MALKIVALLTAAALCLSVAGARAESRPVVVELFTSQGCSSCPPADAILAELAGRGDIIALGFHVDYWDRLGWKDPLSAPGSTARQHHYAALFGRKEVYTPQMLVDGERELVGSNRGAILAAIGDARAEAAASVAFSADRRSITIGAGQGAGHVLLARYLRTRSTPVERGENAGRTAVDKNGVEELTVLGDWSGAPVSFVITPPEANHGLAVLVQAADGKILGAASLDGQS